MGAFSSESNDVVRCSVAGCLALVKSSSSGMKSMFSIRCIFIEITVFYSKVPYMNCPGSTNSGIYVPPCKVRDTTADAICVSSLSIRL